LNRVAHGRVNHYLGLQTLAPQEESVATGVSNYGP